MKRLILLLICSVALPLIAQSDTAAKPSNAAKSGGAADAPAVQVGAIESPELELPADFRVAIYENLVSQLEAGKHFSTVYRAGDTRATSAKPVQLTVTVKKFERGSETKRAVTTVGGATKLTVHVKAVDADGKSLIDQDVNAAVRFYGDNLRATQTLAKHIASLFTAAKQT